jgi:hypothetical protein
MFRKKKHIPFATSLFYRFTTPKKHSAMLCFFGVVNPRTISLFVLSEKVQNRSFCQTFVHKSLWVSKGQSPWHTAVCGTLCKKESLLV